MTTTTTFREYHGDIDEDHLYLIVNTAYIDYCRVSIITDTVVRTAHLSHDTARDLGTSLLRWTGSELCHTIEPVTFTSQPPMNDLVIDIADGEATLRIGADEGVFVILSDEWAIDLAQRLIVWAGVDINETADA